ncbi:MAG: alanyl-tRNA editing protein [Methanobacteriota archaeon]|nr:MAG: alanyl-tRNA editing protein [Euryarchaeota archaeon]|tara:strand:+ start:162 stop:887 length:726 start_codon:yes stop_codon:yes gene_type:complete
MTTDKLYMDSIKSCYLKEFNAEIINIEENQIELNQTLFYPMGGGQDWDTGTIISNGREINVLEVRGRDKISHLTEPNHNLEIGQRIQASIDWDRRYRHMKMHTAQHLVSAVAYDLFDGVRTVGNQLRYDKSRIDFNPINFDDEMLSNLVNETNKLIKNGAELNIRMMTREEINEIMPPERTNMNLIPPNVEELRVVTIGDNLDLCPCAGTHVQNISEIGGIEFLNKKSKGKGTQRFSYTLK